MVYLINALFANIGGDIGSDIGGDIGGDWFILSTSMR